MRIRYRTGLVRIWWIVLLVIVSCRPMDRYAARQGAARTLDHLPTFADIEEVTRFDIPSLQGARYVDCSMSRYEVILGSHQPDYMARQTIRQALQQAGWSIRYEDEQQSPFVSYEQGHTARIGVSVLKADPWFARDPDPVWFADNPDYQQAKATYRTVLLLRLDYAAPSFADC